PRGAEVQGSPGTILGPGDPGTLRVATAQGVLEVARLQLEGEAEQDGATFLSTRKRNPDTRFTSPAQHGAGDAGRRA
ncbi:MAG TPA: hypothetical protein VEU07_10440, partial [Candidatus Acidoferrum sp.]|nr:hypothetical protein [Candidatus Acidoferrum sp.]